jgi:hypothetical protein
LDARRPHRRPRAWDRRRAKPGASYLARRRGEVAQPPSLGREPRSAVRPKRTRVLNLYVEEPNNATTICLDELGPVSPRTYPPAPDWSPEDHRIKAPLEYARVPRRSGFTVRCGCETARLSRSVILRATLKDTCGCSKRSPKQTRPGTFT